MNYLLSASTNIGLSKNINQDSYSARIVSTNLGKMVFAVLCDGMGGLAKGEVASATVVRAFIKWAENRLPVLAQKNFTDNEIRDDWTGIVTDYNEKIKLYGKKCAVSLGTTLTAMLITDKKFYIINVGDTRAYEISDSLYLLTRDQTVVEHEVSLGQITSEQAKIDPRRSVLLQCIGASDNVYPEMFFGSVKQNAVYMLCSDGFRHEISEQEIFDYMNPGAMTGTEIMKNNIDSLIAINMQRNEKDNISVIAIRSY